MAQIVHILYPNHHKSFTRLACSIHWDPAALESLSGSTKPDTISGVMCYFMSQLWIKGILPGAPVPCRALLSVVPAQRANYRVQQGEGSDGRGKYSLAEC